MKAGCKFRELCQLQRSAKVRSTALSAISGFLPPSQKVRNICQPLFLEMEERVQCVLLHQKVCLCPKVMILILTCHAIQFLSILIEIAFLCLFLLFQISIFLFLFQFVLAVLFLFLFLILLFLALISHVLIFLLTTYLLVL